MKSTLCILLAILRSPIKVVLAPVVALAAFWSGPVACGHPEHDPHAADAPEFIHVASVTAAPRVSVVEREGRRIIESNGLPDHVPGAFPRRGNPNRIEPQNYRFEMPLQPVAGPSATPSGRAWFGVARNGVPFEAGTAEAWSDAWRYEAIGGALDLGLDEHRAHVQPTGAYHYHGLPTGLIAKLGGDAGRMLLLGWAADGFPIYSDRAHRDAQDAASPLQRMRSSYRLKPGTRPGSPDGPGGKCDGAFTADYEFAAGSGDLDECNGRTGVTPEYPAGTYFYCVTVEFPFVARAWRGTPDRTFMKGGPGMGPPGGRRGPPERGHPPGPF